MYLYTDAFVVFTDVAFVANTFDVTLIVDALGVGTARVVNFAFVNRLCNKKTDF